MKPYNPLYTRVIHVMAFLTGRFLADELDQRRTPTVVPLPLSVIEIHLHTVLRIKIVWLMGIPVKELTPLW